MGFHSGVHSRHCYHQYVYGFLVSFSWIDIGLLGPFSGDWWGLPAPFFSPIRRKENGDTPFISESISFPCCHTLPILSLSLTSKDRSLDPILYGPSTPLVSSPLHDFLSVFSTSRLLLLRHLNTWRHTWLSSESEWVFYLYEFCPVFLVVLPKSWLDLTSEVSPGSDRGSPCVYPIYVCRHFRNFWLGDGCLPSVLYIRFAETQLIDDFVGLVVLVVKGPLKMYWCSEYCIVSFKSTILGFNEPYISWFI